MEALGKISLIIAVCAGILYGTIEYNKATASDDATADVFGFGDDLHRTVFLPSRVDGVTKLEQEREIEKDGKPVKETVYGLAVYISGLKFVEVYKDKASRDKIFSELVVYITKS